MEVETRTFVAEVKSVNEAKKTVRVTMSNESIDRYKEIVLADAWKKRLDRYKKHPILLSSHNYNKLTNQIGVAERIGVKNGALEAEFRYFAGEGNPEADWGWFLAKNGIAAYSVGFLPYGEMDEDEIKSYVTTNKLKDSPRRIYNDVELLENSQVLVPANAESLQMESFSEEDRVMVKGLIDKVAAIQSGTPDVEEAKDLEDEVVETKSEVIDTEKEIEEMDKVLEMLSAVQKMLDDNFTQINKRIDDVEVKLATIEDIKVTSVKEEIEDITLSDEDIETKKLEDEEAAKAVEAENYLKDVLLSFKKDIEDKLSV